MKKERFELHVSGRPISSHLGYIVGNFFVYQGYFYWRIAHVGTHTRLIGDFARRKDAIAVVEAMDSPRWNFSTLPPETESKKLCSIWIEARNLCKNISGILYLREQDITDTTQ